LAPGTFAIGVAVPLARNVPPAIFTSISKRSGRSPSASAKSDTSNFSTTTGSVFPSASASVTRPAFAVSRAIPKGNGDDADGGAATAAAASATGTLSPLGKGSNQRRSLSRSTRNSNPSTVTSRISTRPANKGFHAKDTSM
jgi:hypothetical protein